MTTATLSRPNGRGSIGVPELVGQPAIVCDGIDLDKPAELENVYTLDGGSGHLVQLTDVPGAGDISPTWSPGHDRVAFGRRIAGQAQLVIHEVRHGVETAYPEACGHACDWIIPTVIVFIGEASDRIFVLNLSTRRVTPIAQAEPGSAFASVDWNPKGGLAVTRRSGVAPAERRDVLVFPPALVRTAAHSRRILTAQDAVPLVGAAATCDSPAWSPDGKLLAVRTQRWGTDLDGPPPDGWGEIAVVDLAGGAWTRVIDDPAARPRRSGADSSPSFSPDGRFLAWLRGDGDEAFQIVVADVSAIGGDEPASGLATWTVAHKHVPAHQYRSLDW